LEWRYVVDLDISPADHSLDFVHIVYTYNKTTEKLYANNVLKHTRNITLTFTDNPVRIGGRTGGYDGQYSNSVIDEVIIWNKALTPDEITTLYASGSPSRHIASGTYTTDVIDLGAIPHSNKSLLVKEDVDDTRTITWKYSGSLDNSTWTDTATTGNGQDIGAYRYYKVQSVMATTNSDTTPSFNFIEIDPTGVRRSGKEERIRRKW